MWQNQYMAVPPDILIRVSVSCVPDQAEWQARKETHDLSPRISRMPVSCRQDLSPSSRDKGRDTHSRP